MIPNVRVSVVIPVRDRAAQLGDCLRCLAAQSLPPEAFEVIVCDDGSSPQELRQLEQLCARRPQVRLVRQPARGPAAARNLGIGVARGAIIAFTDSDTLPSPSWLENLIVPFSDPAVVGAEGPVRPPRPRQSPLEDAPRGELGACLTANVAYRRSALVYAGGLDEAFPLPAFEDAELALALRELGSVRWVPGALVIHPWRRVTLRCVVQGMRRWDWLLVTALRHGCLGWEKRPTRHPRLRVALAAAATLPLGRAARARGYLTKAPLASLEHLAQCAVQAILGLVLAPRWLLFPSPPPRGRFLYRGAA